MRTIALLATVVLAFDGTAQNSPVVPTGAMRNTMFNGQLAGLIQMDTVAKPGTYGIGPLEYLRGELLVLDGTAYVSTAAKEGSMTVEQRPAVRAPFFVHQHVEQWTTVALPDSVVDLMKLDAFLTARYASAGIPFAFRLQGIFASVDAHIVDVPMGTEVNGPDDVHRHNKDYHAEGRTMDIVASSPLSTRRYSRTTTPTSICMRSPRNATGWDMWSTCDSTLSKSFSQSRSTSMN